MRSKLLRAVLMVGLLLVATAAAVWWTRVPSAPDVAASTSTQTSEATPDLKTVVAQKRAARAEIRVNETPATASGVVIFSETRAPAPNAVVLLSAYGPPSEAMRGRGAPSEPLTVQADAAGQWSIDGVPPGDYNISASAPGAQPGVLSNVRVSPGADHPGLKVEVSRGGHRLHGTVSDLSGGPVSDVLVSVTGMGEDSLLSFARAPWPARTDDEGRYEIFVPAGFMSVSTSHPDYVDASRTLTVPEGGATLDLSLLPGGAVAGVVRARSDGRTIAGAEVSITGGSAGGGGAGFPGMGGMGAGATVRTDAEGRFRIPGLSAGTLKVRATARGMATRAPVEVSLAIAHEVDGVELWLDDAFSISGFVVERGTGGEQGLEGVMVMAMSLRPPAMLQARGPSEGDGFFEIHGAKPGTYILMALDAAHVPSMMQTSVVVSDGDVTDAVVELDSGVYVEGQVLPPGPAQIEVVLPESPSMAGMMQAAANMLVKATAKPDGTFRMGPFAPNNALNLQGKAADGATGTAKVAIADEDVQGVTIQLTPRARIVGTVTDPRGGPVQGATVEIESAEPAAANLQMSIGGMLTANSITGDDGRYEKQGLDEGEYEVLVKGAGGFTMLWAGEEGEAAQQPRRVRVADGAKVTLDLAVQAHDGIIRGTVFGEDGRPAPDVFVRAAPRMDDEEFSAARGRGTGADDDGTEIRVEVGTDAEARAYERLASRPVLSDEDGRFELVRLRRGVYDVIAEGAKGTTRGVAESVSTGANTRVMLEQLGSLSCAVTYDGAPVTVYKANLEGPDDRVVNVDDPTGTLEARWLKPGTYEVLVKSSEGFGSATVEVESGGEASCAVTLQVLGKLTGVLLDSETGKPISGMTLLLQDASNDMSDFAAAVLTGDGVSTGADGRFTAEQVAPGPVNVLFLNRMAVLTNGSPMVGVSMAVVGSGGTTEMGTVRGWRGDEVDEDTRGSLGLGLEPAIFEKRPGQPDDPNLTHLEPGAVPMRLWVESLRAGGPAQTSGVQLEDEIVSIDGVPVSQMGAYPASERLRDAFVTLGQSVVLEVVRGDEIASVTVVAGPVPEK